MVVEALKQLKKSSVALLQSWLAVMQCRCGWRCKHLPPHSPLRRTSRESASHCNNSLRPFPWMDINFSHWRFLWTREEQFLYTYSILTIVSCRIFFNGISQKITGRGASLIWQDLSPDSDFPFPFQQCVMSLLKQQTQSAVWVKTQHWLCKSKLMYCSFIYTA